MLTKSSKEFKAIASEKLNFNVFENENYILYTNRGRPELGYLINYSRDGYYNLILEDYTISKDFTLSFENYETSIRFGLIYKGITELQLKNNPLSSFTHSSFFIVEKDIKNIQKYKKGQHYHGIEIIINERYFTEIIKPNFPQVLDFDFFIKNYTYTYLPLEIINIIHQLQSLSNKNLLNNIYLESKILECIAILINEISKSAENAFTNQINYGNVSIGNNRIMKLTSSDIHAIQKTHDILFEKYLNPPSIRELSKLLFINEQKLKAGFAKHYHMTIGECVIHIRMNAAANLLVTTDLSVEDIAGKVGYNYSANFSKMFKKIYGKTPLKFRKIK